MIWAGAGLVVMASVLYGWQSTREPDPREYAKVAASAIIHRKFDALYEMSPESEREVVGWTQPAFVRLMSTVTKNLPLESGEIDFTTESRQSATNYSCTVKFHGAKKFAFPITLHRNGRRWMLDTYALPGQACRAGSKNDRERAECLIGGLQASGLTRVVHPYSRVQKDLESLEMVAAGKISYGRSSKPLR